MDLKILEIASHTENKKELSNPTHFSKNKNPICGDEMEISLVVKKISLRIWLTIVNLVYIARLLLVCFQEQLKIKVLIHLKTFFSLRKKCLPTII